VRPQSHLCSKWMRGRACGARLKFLRDDELSGRFLPLCHQLSAIQVFHESARILFLGMFTALVSAQARREEGVTPRRQLLCAVRLGRLGDESEGGKLIAQSRDVQESHNVDFTTTPIKVTDTAKGFDVSDQGSLTLVLCCFDQDRPIVT